MEDSTSESITHKVLFAAEKEEVVACRPVSFPFAWLHEKELFVEKYFSEDSTYFIQYNKCWSKELEDAYNKGKNSERLPSFKEFEDQVFKTVEENPIKKMIVDIRFNSGGNSKQGTDFIKRIAANEKINRKGVLYVITGRQTFSSAVINATDFKNTTSAIFVGEETGGKPKSFW